MPLLNLLRLVFAVLSLAILALGGYLAWSWWEGRTVIDTWGYAHRVRDDWRLWTAAALIAWSLLGRLVAPRLVAGPDRSAPSRAVRRSGGEVASPTGAQLYVEALGAADAPAIVLTHGWGLDSTIWERAKRHLSGQFRLIAWDLAGLGRSRLPPDGGLSLDRMAQDLEAVIAQSGSRPVVLVGHSIGGMVIQTLARNRPELYPDTVAGVVLLNTTYTNPLRTMVLGKLAQALRRPLIEPAMWLTIWLSPLAWLAAWQSYLSGSAHLANRFGFGRHATRSELEHVTLLATRNSPAVQAKGNLAMFRWDAADDLQRLTWPVLVVGGDMDLITKLEAGERIATAAPQARLEVVEGVNHMGFLERAETYDQIIERFASQRLGTSRGGEQALAARA